MIDISGFVLKKDLLKLEVEHGAAFFELAERSESFLLRFKWCSSIKQLYFVNGIPQFCVFYCEIEPLYGADPYVWVITGDIPPAYMDSVDHVSAREAIETYLDLMQLWVDTVRRGESTEDLMPVYDIEGADKLADSIDIANMLDSRLSFIKEKLIQLFD